jgi:hypothetical protein
MWRRRNGGGGEGRMFADSSGSKLTCACVETKKEEKLKGNKWPNLENSKCVTTWCLVRSMWAARGASIYARMTCVERTRGAGTFREVLKFMASIFNAYNSRQIGRLSGKSYLQIGFVKLWYFSILYILYDGTKVTRHSKFRMLPLLSSDTGQSVRNRRILRPIAMPLLMDSTMCFSMPMFSCHNCTSLQILKKNMATRELLRWERN